MTTGEELERVKRQWFGAEDLGLEGDEAGDVDANAEAERVGPVGADLEVLLLLPLGLEWGV